MVVSCIFNLRCYLQAAFNSIETGDTQFSPSQQPEAGFHNHLTTGLALDRFADAGFSGDARFDSLHIEEVFQREIENRLPALLE
jgi:hypothetical protein